MNNHKNIILPVAVFFFAVALLYMAMGSERSTGTEAPVAETTPTVAATIFPLYDIVRNVGADVVAVELILPANAEPHTYEPTPNAMKAIASSKVVYAIGHNLDNWVLPLTEASKIPVLTVDRDIALRAGGHEEGSGYDPHYWMSTANAKTIAVNVARDLVERFPDRALQVAQNLAAYSDVLDQTDAEIRRLLEPVADRRLATFHEAFGYFADAYGLEIAATFEPYPGQEPTPRYLADLSTEVKRLQLKTVYHEPAFNAAALKSFATENGLALGELDDLGGAVGRDSLVTTLIYDAQSIANHQR